MTKKILHAIVLVSTVSLILGFLLVSGHSFVNYSRFVSSQLDNELELAVQGVEFGGTGYLEALDDGMDDSEDYRFTLISKDGQVLYDNETSLAYTENHKDRPEIKQAMETGEGMDTRYSSTLLEVSIYRAKRLSDGSILRISESRQSVLKVVLIMMLPFGLGLAVSCLVAMVCARRMALKVVDPINSLDLERPLDNDVYPEITPLLKRIYFQRQEIDEQLLTLQRRADEFDQISRSMSEGLMVLDVNGSIVSINDAAMDMFDLDKSCVGHSFLEVYRTHDFSTAVKNALSSGHEELRLERNGRVVRFSMSRMMSAGTVLGLVILSFDITEKAAAEDMRREFSANVSHELKTPLQGIMGSAELIEAGMAKGDDAKRFASNIRKEASRMVNLVEDIMGLSQLDEGVSSAYEVVDVASVADDVHDELSDVAKAKDVSIEVHSQGRPVEVMGVPRLIHEMLYNLVDNAIKYNVQGGRVDVSVSHQDSLGAGNSVVLEVSDTGIGIPKEHLPRVFERFYRVDKSHSRASGGTGLGLSIVKHVVMYHGGKVSVESKVGSGTKFTVVLPCSPVGRTM